MSTDDNDAVARLLLRQNNVISRRQAVCLLGPGAIRHRLATGRWQRANRGVYFAGSEPFLFASEDQRRSVVDAARWARFDDRARAVIAAAHQQQLVGDDDVERAVAMMPRARRRDPILEAARDAQGGVHSLPEAEFIRLCRSAGLPRPTCQVIRDDSAGQRRYLDAVFGDWKVHVEIDGGQHMDVRQWWADMKRQNDLWVPGARVLRFPSWAIRHRSGEVVAQLRVALIAAGWRA